MLDILPITRNYRKL